MPLQPPHLLSNCMPSEISSVSAGSAVASGQQPPVVIASSVMADDGQRIKSAPSSAASATYAKSAWIYEIPVSKNTYTLFTDSLVGVCLGWVLKRFRGT